RARGRQQVREVVGSKRKSNFPSQHLQPTLLRQMIEAVVVAKKIVGTCATPGKVFARTIEPIGDDSQFSRDQSLLDGPHQTKRKIRFALAETGLARFTDEFDPQARMPSLNL